MENTSQEILQPFHYFSSVIYTIDKPDFLNSVQDVATDALNATKQTQSLNDAYPMIMSPSMVGDARIKDFEQFIAQASWAILDGQGYSVDNLGAYVSEMWAQEHLKYSGMEQHVHSEGVVLSGFYFLNAPEGGQMVEIHDPRPGKVQASLKIKDLSQVKEANNSLFIKPKAGLLVISNSWLPHSFTRNTTNTPCKFIHFNVSLTPLPKQEPIIV